MKRPIRVVLATAVVALALALAFAVPLLADDERVDPYLTFVTAHLDVLPTKPLPVSADAKFSRRITRFTDLESADPALAACAGPVAVYLGDQRPRLVSEHDYCGGSDWMPKLDPDDVVQLTGPGVEAGLYTAETIKHVPRYESTINDLPDGDVVLQTCISKKTMVLVGLRLAAPAAT